MGATCKFFRDNFFLPFYYDLENRAYGPVIRFEFSRSCYEAHGSRLINRKSASSSTTATAAPHQHKLVAEFQAYVQGPCFIVTHLSLPSAAEIKENISEKGFTPFELLCFIVYLTAYRRQRFIIFHLPNDDPTMKNWGTRYQFKPQTKCMHCIEKVVKRDGVLTQVDDAPHTWMQDMNRLQPSDQDIMISEFMRLLNKP
jgi:hypothetical protein